MICCEKKKKNTTVLSLLIERVEILGERNISMISQSIQVDDLRKIVLHPSPREKSDSRLQITTLGLSPLTPLIREEKQKKNSHMKPFSYENESRQMSKFDGQQLNSICHPLQEHPCQKILSFYYGKVKIPVSFDSVFHHRKRLDN